MSTIDNDSIHVGQCIKIECGFGKVLKYGSANCIKIGYSSSAQGFQESGIVLR